MTSTTSTGRCALLVCVVLCGAAARAGGQPAASAAATESPAATRGRQLFTQNCAPCHGPGGRGGADAASDLARSAIATATDSAQPGGGQLGAFLKVGRPERRMPGFALTDAQVADLSTFLRAMLPAIAAGGGARGGVIEANVVGDAKAGEAYFNGAGGCRACHAPDGNLKGIGTRLPVAAIQGRLVMPRGNGGYPRSFNAPPDPAEASRTVTITQPSGETIAGTLLWFTDFNVTLTDPAGIRRTIARRGDVPKVVVVDPLQAHIDHLKILTDENMHNLTAYLVTLK
jgi:cytochrome c oxidase cbb3-type subunit 3